VLRELGLLEQPLLNPLGPVPLVRLRSIDDDRETRLRQLGRVIHLARRVPSPW
jgi:hypothetical protein